MHDQLLAPHKKRKNMGQQIVQHWIENLLTHMNVQSFILWAFNFLLLV